MLVTCLILLAGSHHFQTIHIPLSSGAIDALASNLGVEPLDSRFEKIACEHLEDTLLASTYGEDSESSDERSQEAL